MSSWFLPFKNLGSKGHLGKRAGLSRGLCAETTGQNTLQTLYQDRSGIKLRLSWQNASLAAPGKVVQWHMPVIEGLG